jgi:hypothetical protein
MYKLGFHLWYNYVCVCSWVKKNTPHSNIPSPWKLYAFIYSITMKTLLIHIFHHHENSTHSNIPSPWKLYSFKYSITMKTLLIQIFHHHENSTHSYIRKAKTTLIHICSYCWHIHIPSIRLKSQKTHKTIVYLSSVTHSRSCLDYSSLIVASSSVA